MLAVDNIVFGGSVIAFTAIKHHVVWSSASSRSHKEQAYCGKTNTLSQQTD